MGARKGIQVRASFSPTFISAIKKSWDGKCALRNLKGKRKDKSKRQKKRNFEVKMYSRLCSKLRLFFL